jgi:methylthioxylose transferase
VVLVVVLPGLAVRVGWAVLLPGSAVLAAGWAVALALASGWHRLWQPLAVQYEYPHDVPRVGSIGQFLRTFVDSVPADSPHPWTTHVAGHPPLATLAFVALDRLGLTGLSWAAAMCIAGGALAVPAVLTAVRAVAGEDTARTAAPFLVLAPVALWVATSADALFAGVSAWGVALVAAAAARDGGLGRDLRALAGGLLLGAALFLSFGLTALGLLVLGVVLLHRGRLGWGGVARVLAVAAAGVLVVVLAFALGGYWWLDGFHAAGDRVRTGPSYADRPFRFFVVSNLAAGALAIGPAAVGGLAALRRSRLAVLPLAALAGVLASDVSGLVRGETERIWLPFYVWLLPAAAFLPARQRRAWLLAGAVLAIWIEVHVRLEW